MPLGTHRVTRKEVQRGNHGRFATQCRLGVLADQLARLVVVGREQGVGGLHRVGRAVQRNHHHALGTGLADGRHDGLGIRRRDENGFRAGSDHVFHGGDLAGVVAVGLARGREQLGAQLFRLGIGPLLHLHEEGVGFGLGDQANDGLGLGGRAVGGQGEGGHGKEAGKGFHVVSWCRTVGSGWSLSASTRVFTLLVWRGG